MAQPSPRLLTYPFAIPSLDNRYPALRNIQNVPGLSDSAAAGAPLDSSAISNAKVAVASLSSLLNAGNPVVTPAVVESAENRLAVLQQVHGAEEYGTGNIMAILARIEASQTRMQTRMQANLENIRRWQLNARDSHGHSANKLTHMMVKTVPGSGHILAQMCRQDGGTPIAPINPVPDIGAVHTLNPGNIDSMPHAEILDLIVFYNEDFGIVADDNLAARRDKVKEWLV